MVTAFKHLILLGVQGGRCANRSANPCLVEILPLAMSMLISPCCMSSMPTRNSLLMDCVTMKVPVIRVSAKSSCNSTCPNAGIVSLLNDFSFTDVGLTTTAGPKLFTYARLTKDIEAPVSKKQMTSSLPHLAEHSILCWALTLFFFTGVRGWWDFPDQPDWRFP